MPRPAWGEDSTADEAVIAENLPGILQSIQQSAARPREVPLVDMAHDWHKALYQGVSSVPGPHFLGNPRGSDHPDLRGYEVAVRDSQGRVVGEGIPATEVKGALRAFQQSMRQAVGNIDRGIQTGATPADERQLLAVINLAAELHGEWVRIHPYANGNGRIARIWANWAAVRYGLPPFVRIKPRPDGLLYAHVASRSMGMPPDYRGNHEETASLFIDLLRNPAP